MFDYQVIEHLLSKSARTALSDEEKYSQISEAVGELMSNISGYTTEELAELEWTKTPYVFLLEYFVFNRVENVTQEFQAKAQSHYKNAMEILKNNKKSFAASKLGTIEGLYDAEF